MAGADHERRGPLDDTLPMTSESPPGAVPPSLSTTGPGRYQLGAELGRGGMGRVVEAFDAQLGRMVALKEVLISGGGSGSATVRRFEREVALTARLEHPSIVPIYDSGVTPDGRPFYVMRRVSGRPFDELVKRARGLDERLTLVPALLAAIDAVAHAHRRGVIHRDLKPQNILVGDLGETIVIDWGLAKVIGEEDESGDQVVLAGDSLQTQMGSVFGTPGFMAPEQARGEELSTRGDVYALGATLYQLLAGTPPHQGNSATELIDKTARDEVRPLAEVAPGAPAELVAIVDKALSFEARKRYPNAAALAADVRRFLAGQLVAAHRYTAGQRVARFAKRHRAPLGVAALAFVAVAVLSWISVARILAERDEASKQRTAAELGQRAAEKARAELAERHDDSLITQARGLLETSPTDAVAVLKALSPKSRREDDARAVAQAAAVRGVGWAVESARPLSRVSELDPTGRYLVQVTHPGELRVWDLVERRLVVLRRYPTGSLALWVAGGRVLVMPPETPPQLLEPIANTVERLPLEAITEAAVSARGERVVFTTAAPGVKLFDVASRAVTELARGVTARAVAIAPDGAWLAYTGADEVVAVDAAGKELARRAGAYDTVVVSRKRSLAVASADGKVVECRLDPAPAWTELQLGLAKPHRALGLIYRGGELVLMLTTGSIVSWAGHGIVQRAKFDKLTYGGTPRVVGDDTLIYPAGEGELRYFNSLASGTLRLPGIVQTPRIAAIPGSNRLAIVAVGVVIGFDLSMVVPRVIPTASGTEAFFVDDATLLTVRSVENWAWHDLATGKETPIRYDMRGLPFLLSVDAPSGRVLMREEGSSRLMLFRKGSPEVREVAVGQQAIWGELISGDALVYAVGDGRLFAQRGTAEAREIAKLDGKIISAVGLGPLKFAVRSTGGEIVRGDLATQSLERTRVAPTDRGFLASDREQRVLIVDGPRLSRWDTGVTEIATFGQAIQRVDPYENGAVVHFTDREVQVIELRPGAKPLRVLQPTREFAGVSFDGKLVVGVGNNYQIHAVELPGRASWTLPTLFNAGRSFAVAPTSRRILQQGAFGAHALWTLPLAGPDFGAWLDELTNASVDRGGILAWPWQRVPVGDL